MPNNSLPVSIQEGDWQTLGDIASHIRAVLAKARGAGIGGQLMAAAIATAQRVGHPEVALSSQLHALAFYERLGFVAHGEVFMDAGIPHREMTLTFS
ncbi:MAG: GNAT family N-acetyltransferase [Halomonas sp.]|nr:GNAT family N-acetyltransferase [Halomonas sp.]